MTEGTDPRLLDRLAATRARFEADIADIREQSAQAERGIVEKNEERRQQAEQLSKELDEQVAANKEAREDPNSKNEWLQRRDDGGGRTMDFGPTGDSLEEASTDSAPQSAAAPPRPPAVEPPSPQPSPPTRPSARRHSAEDDDEDFANRDWFV